MLGECNVVRDRGFTATCLTRAAAGVPCHDPFHSESLERVG